MPGFFSSSRKIEHIILVLICILNCNLPISSQDVHLSMYEYAPLYINAANTGNFNGDWRISGGYRNQFVATADPFRTASLGFDSRFFVKNQKIGIGIFFLNDVSGIGGLTYNKVYASIGYQKEISKNYFSLGFQAGYVFGSVNSWNTWDHGTGGFNAPNGEENFGENVTYADFNLGMHWKRSIRKIEPEIGIAIAHLNTPNSSFLDGDESLGIRYTIDTRAKINFSEKFFVTPSIYYSDNEITHAMLGARAGYNTPGEKSSVKQLTAGMYLRNGLTGEISTIVFTMGATVRRLDIGISYDMNNGGFSEVAGTRGAFEVSFIYRSISTVLNSYSIPCERY